MSTDLIERPPEDAPDEEPNEVDQAMLDLDHAIKVLHEAPDPALRLYKQELTTYGAEMLKIIGRANKKSIFDV